MSVDNNDSTQRHSSGWREWSNYVLTALEKCDQRLITLESRIRTLEVELMVLKTKVALYIAVASSVIVLIIEIGRRYAAH